jgi:hypothetical protein
MKALFFLAMDLMDDIDFFGEGGAFFETTNGDQ